MNNLVERSSNYTRHAIATGMTLAIGMLWRDCINSAVDGARDRLAKILPLKTSFFLQLAIRLVTALVSTVLVGLIMYFGLDVSEERAKQKKERAS